MTAIELKKLVLQRVSEINDISFLNALNTILESRVQPKKISLSAEQSDEILLSKKEIEAGLFIEQDSLNKTFEKWQKEK